MGVYQQVPITGNGMQMLPSGALAISPFTVANGQYVKMVAIQTAPTQDFSMRAWISRLPEGPSEGTNHYTRHWPINRIAEIVVIYDRNLPVPDIVGRLIAVDPGDYYVNILNLVNEENSFSFAQGGLNSVL